LIHVIVGVALIGVIAVTNAKTPSREPFLPGISRMLSGADPVTPQMRRRWTALAVAGAIVAAGFWTLFVTEVHYRHWSLELAIMASLVALAGLFWIIAGWIGARRRNDR
jgi:hypothetical protein